MSNVPIRRSVVGYLVIVALSVTVWSAVAQAGPTPAPTPTPTPTPTGSVVGWGYDATGQATPPAAVNGVSGTATDIAAGNWYSCAIQAGTGNVVCWGDDHYGQATPPDAVNGVSGTATDIAAGGNHTLAIALPEPTAWLGQLAGLSLLFALHRLRAHRRRGRT